MIVTQQAASKQGIISAIYTYIVYIYLYINLTGTRYASGLAAWGWQIAGRAVIQACALSWLTGKCM